MPSLDSCINSLYEPGFIGGSSGETPTVPVITSSSEARFTGTGGLSINALRVGGAQGAAMFSGTGTLRIDAQFGEPWTPSDLGSTLLFWVRGDDLSGSDGDEVLLWEDQSGNGNDATGSAGNGPQLEVAELNSMNVVRGVRANSDRLTTTNFMSGATAGTLIFVAKAAADSGATAGSLVETSAQFLAPAFYPHSDGNVYDAFGSNAQKTVGDPPAAMNTWHISGFTSATNDWKYYQNGDVFFTTATNTVAWGSSHLLFVSDLSGGTTQYGDGMLAEVIICDSVLSTGDRQKAEGYLAHKWGIASVLDSGHPYKSTPP